MQLDKVFKRITNSLPLMFAFVDNERRYQFVNKAYSRFFNVPLEKIRGKHVSEVVGAESYKKIAKLHEYVLAGNEHRFTDQVELQDGRRLQLDVTYIPNINDETNTVEGFFAVINDITAHASAAEVLRAVHDVVHTQRKLVSTERVNKLLRLGCHYLRCELGIVSHVEGDDYIVKYVHSEGDPIPQETAFELGDTYCSVTLKANEIVATESASKSEHFHGHPCVDKFKLETYLGLPLQIDNQVWGTLNFSSTHPRTVPFTELDIELMTLLCSAIETILTNRSKTLELERLANHDFLTGLTNRFFLTQQFEALHRQTQLPGRRTAFMLVDIDKFKQVNDNYGHDVGDEVLQAVAAALSANVRLTDACARIGGEEFALVVPSVTPEKAKLIAEHIRAEVEKLRIQYGKTPDEALSVTVSIGGAFVGDEDTLSQVYKNADAALYESKNNGRNRVHWNDST